MPIPSDYKELLKLLNTGKVKYLVVGAYAVTHYTEPRYTKDIDIWIDTSLSNARKVYQALKKFGAPLDKITPEDFTNRELIYQIGVAPVRVDIIMNLTGLTFNRAWKNRTITSLAGVKTNIIGLKELIKAKAKTRREIDGIDIKNLRYAVKETGKKKQS